MALYFDDFLEEEDDEVEKDCEILVDMRALISEIEDTEPEYKDEEDEEEDLDF